nr:SDR family NAD(P)-dependent oxidoreductase [Catenulispora pinisilvae]
MFPGDTTAATDEKTFDEVYAVNVKAPFFLTGEIAPAMAAAGGGSVINLGSWIARLAVPVGALYSSTKGAMETLTRSWAAEFGPQGVRVNAISPGVVLEPWPDQSHPGEAMMNGTPAGRMGRPGDRARRGVPGSRRVSVRPRHRAGRGRRADRGRRDRRLEVGTVPKELTAKGQATRGRVIEAAAEVLRKSGIEGVTLEDVMARSHTSKSQLFHYFPDGKDQLLLAVAQYEADQVLDVQQPYLGCLDSWEAWQQWRDVTVRHYEEQGERCPLGTLALYLGRSTPGARAVVIELMRRWQEYLAVGIRALRTAGHLPADLDVDERAAALLAAVQGGVMILQATGRADHLRAALDLAIGDLRRLGESAPAPAPGEDRARARG